MDNYIKDNFKCGQREFDSVDWHAIEKGRKGLSKKDNIKVAKLMADWVNTGHQKGKMHQEACCLGCGIEDETLLHMFQCKHKEVEKTWKESLEVIRKTLMGTNCPPHILSPFMEVIHSIVEDRDVEIDNQV